MTNDNTGALPRLDRSEQASDLLALIEPTFSGRV